MSEAPQTKNDPQPPAAPGGFDLNHPTIVSLLYLGSYLTGGIAGIVGVILAFVWRGEGGEPWEESHYTYLINTFWIGLIGSIVSFILLFVLIGILTMIAVAVWVLIRSVLSLVKAQKREPMPNPDSWTI